MPSAKQRQFPSLRRDFIVGLRFNAAELEAIDRMANGVGVGRSTLIRQLICEFLSARSRSGEGEVR
jgi:hypothetical protein